MINEYSPTNEGLSEFSSWLFDWRQNTWGNVFFEAEHFAGYQLKSGLVTETFVYRRQAGAEYCVERYVDAVVFIGAKPFELLMHACVSAWADYEVEFDTMLNTFRRAD
jgi:hypothetical protein